MGLFTGRDFFISPNRETRLAGMASVDGQLQLNRVGEGAQDIERRDNVCFWIFSECLAYCLVCRVHE